MRKRRPFKKVVSAMLAVSMILTLLLSTTVLAEEQTTVTGIVEDVVVYTTVKPAGQYPDSIEVTVKDAAVLEGLTAGDFSIAGQATAWLTSQLHEFTATISEVAVEGNVLTLTIGEFDDKYVYVDNYTVTCSANEALTFTCDKNTTVITPIADEFEQIREEAEGGFDYNLYTPEDTSKPQPIVIAFHGYGDNENLYQNKLAVAWADPVNQAERPCYVLAPSVANYFDGEYCDGLFEKVHEEVQAMIEEGKVDPNRIYVVGKSFGGGAVYEFLEKYPDDIAGAIAMCGAANTYGLFTQGEEDVQKITDIPLWITHATTDNVVNVERSREMNEMLTAAGSTVVKYKEYSDEEMTAAGVTAAMGNHSMEAVVLEDETYLEWLFEQTNAEETEITFTDVEEGRYYYDAVAWAVKNEITTGMTETTFVPEGTCTRAQVVTFLWRASGSPEPQTTETAFTDIDPERFYYKAVLWAVENGITTGVTETTFDPEGLCTRAQVVTFLYRANGEPEVQAAETAFTDVEEGRFYYKAMLWAVENGITTGVTETTFVPNATCTRGEVVTFLYRAE